MLLTGHDTGVDDLRHHGDAEVGPGLVDLAVNVRAGTPPRWLRERLVASLADLAAYPDPSAARAALARRHGRPVDEVVPTAGAAEAFVLLARTLVPRRAVVVHPQFTEPEAALRAAGHAVERVVLRGGFALDPDDVPADADLVVVGNPTNPTSVAHPARTLEALARPGRVLVVDEAFADTVPGEPDSLADRRDLPGLVVLRSLTKTWGLAGLRVGYVLAPTDLAACLRAAAPPWSVSTPALAAIEACSTPAALAEAAAAAAELAADRAHLLAALSGVPSVEVRGAPASSFVLLRTPGRTDVRVRLRDAGWAVRRGETFPGLDAEHVRVAVRDADTSTRFVAALGGDPVSALEPGDREALYRVLRARRDVRTGFTDAPVSDERLRRVLEAAHTAPSVGFSQPWDFLVLRSPALRDELAVLAQQQRAAFAASLPAARARAFAGLRVEAIREAPVGVVVTCDPTRGGRHVLGRHTQPRMAAHSVAGAVQNLWLAARAEGLGVGWVSFFDERELAAVLGLPAHLEIVAYLCVGHVEEFADEPELATAGWARRRPLDWAVHHESWGAHTVDPLAETLAAVADLDPTVGAAAAREHLARMTVPPGALGEVAEIGVRLAGLAGTCPPPAPEPAVVAVFAGDHGVHARGVTPWPQEVTTQMVGNFLAGGAAVNAFAATVGAEVLVVDVGVAADLGPAPGLLPRKVRPGTADMTAGPAMTREEARRAVVVGVETARDLVAAGNRLLVTGDMGIANTTASAALVAAFTGASAHDVTGRGTGIDDATHARKTAVIAEALARHGLAPVTREGSLPALYAPEGTPRAVQDDPLGALAAVGGLEHAGLVGFLLGAAAMRTPVVLDGVVSGAAALVAAALAPTASHAWLAGHRSVEPAHTLALTHLGLAPALDLGLRVGEGTGALLAIPLVAAAARALADVATFDAAGVTEKSTDDPEARP